MATRDLKPGDRMLWRLGERGPLPCCGVLLAVNEISSAGNVRELVEVVEVANQGHALWHESGCGRTAFVAEALALVRVVAGPGRRGLVVYQAELSPVAAEPVREGQVQ